MDRNQPIATYIRDLFNPLKKPMFPEMSVRVLTEAKNVNVDHIFDLRSHVYCNVGQW